MRKALLLVSTMALAVLLASAVALADDVDCSTSPCLGTGADDHIDGTNNAEVIKARAGNDDIDGLDGADTLYAGLGNDGEPSGNGVAGGNGSDTSYGDAGDDLLTDFDLSGHNSCTDISQMCTGSDTQRGGDGGDYLEGGFEKDFLYGEGSSDLMYGDPGNDLVSGGDGPDDIEGEEGSDDLRGGSGNDSIDAADEETAGSIDTVSCGRGSNDVAIANENDEVSGNCEDVSRVPNPPEMMVEDAASSSESVDDEQDKAREEFLAENE